MNTTGKKILIAEDDLDLKLIYHFLLDDSGLELIEADDGDEAVRKYREHRPDLVLMDIRMPGKSGREAIKEILEEDPGARILAVTAYNYTEEDLGVPVLRKGFRREEFLKVLEEYLGRIPV